MKIRKLLPTLIVMGIVSITAIGGFVYADILSHSSSVESDINETTNVIFVDCTKITATSSDDTLMPYISILPAGYETKLEALSEHEGTDTFISGYEEHYGEYSDVNLETTTNPVTGGVPLLMQWDTRWGYRVYGSNAMGFTGCGPTCLSMVASYLLEDASLTPSYIAEFSENNGYCVIGSGTSWSLMSEGASALGLSVTEVPLDEQIVIDNLEDGNPIICIMGPGVFTVEGHFIVLADYEDGYYTINDPYDLYNSGRYWTYDEFYDQIQCMWAYSV